MIMPPSATPEYASAAPGNGMSVVFCDATDTA